MKRQILWPVLAVVLVTGVGIIGATSANSADRSEAILVGGVVDRVVEETVWFQGFIADVDTGEPINATYNMAARIYTVPVGGGAIWGPEAHNGVTIEEGWFNIELGSVIGGLPAFDDPPYYAQLTIDGEILMPRLKLASVPTALRAGSSEDGSLWYEIDEGIAYADTIAIGTSYPSQYITIQQHFGEPAWMHFRPAVIREDGPSRMWEGAILGLLPMDMDFYVVNTDEIGWLWLGAGDYPTAAVTDSAKLVVSPYAFGGGGPRPGMEPPGVLTVDNGPVGDYGAAIYSAQEYNAAHTLHAEYYGNQAYATAVYGDATQGDLWTSGGEFRGNGYGVYASAEGEGSSGFMYGVRGQVSNGTGTSNLYSIYGADPIGAGSTKYAGYFAGDTHVDGTLTKAAGSFKIDHPLDPENMYLSHSFVESPDMMNVYNGNVELDGVGEATVRLPDYFDALNRDFRYQLTCIGAFAPVYVAEEISGSSFRIAGGEPGMKVSWMVTGIRQDRYAEENRIQVEQPKTGHALGRYLHPEEHGLPATMDEDYVEEIETARAAADAANKARSARQAEARAQARAAGETDWRKK